MEKPWDSQRAQNRWNELPEAERVSRTQRADRLLWAALNISVDKNGQARRTGQNWRPITPPHNPDITLKEG